MAFVCGIGPMMSWQGRDDGNPPVLGPISENGKDHITISFRENSPFDNTDELEYWPDHIEVEVVGEDMFGDNNDIPVYRVRFVGIELAGILTRFHHQTEYRTPGNEIEGYSPHITQKHLSGPLTIGTRLMASRIFIKKVGTDDSPLYERHLGSKV